MTSQQVWSFLPVAALLLLLTVHTLAEVVKSMSDCSQFFLDQTPPHVPGILEDGEILDQNRYKPICQTFNNTRRFVTLYDTQNKIPVFSAFRFVEVVDTKNFSKWWKIEPQLEDETADKNMELGEKDKEYDHQAGDVDYRDNNIYDRGHLFPSSYASTIHDKESTFTLTNIVPQVKSFNRGSWKNMEQCIKCVMEKYCINNNNDIEGFVVTGAEPSSGNLLNNRVNVPSALWSAFCCYSANMEAWIASAHWGDNVPDESEEKFLETITLEALYQKLSMSDSGFLFSGKNCPLQTTVTEFYPEMNQNCSCPPTNPEPLPTPSGSFAPTESGSFAPTPSGSFVPTPSGSFTPPESGSFTPPPPLRMCQDFRQVNKKQIFGSIEEISRVITQLQLLQLETTRRAQILGAETDSDLNLYPKTITKSAFCRQRIIFKSKGLMSQQDLEELTDAVVFYGLDHCNIVFTCFPLKVDQNAAADPERCCPCPH